MFAASKTDGASLAQTDPFFSNVSLLMNTSGTNGAQNNTFIDSSTNNFTITRNGNTTQGSVSPYGEDWANYFDGTGDYLSIGSNAAFGFGTGAFTIECWFNTQAIPALGADYLFDMRTTGSQAAMLAYITTGASLEVVVNGAAVITGGTVVVNRWNHFALARSGTTTRMFLNGVQVGSSYTDNNNYVSPLPVVIASRYTAEDFYQGYISNFRVIKGTALYTANFTPSTVPLQPVAGTSLLTCKDPNIVDDSPYQFAITRTGDVRTQSFGPFAGTTLTTPYYGAYFDGSGDILTLASNAALGFAAGDFTLEMWYYTTVTPTATNVILYANGTNNFFLQVRSTAFGIGQAEVAENNAFSFSFAANQWYHIAVARSGSTVRGFVNGTLVGTGSNSINYGQSGATIGGLTSSTFLITGHISNLRAVKGQALYTASFTPSTVPLTTTSQGATAGNVSLLTCQSSTFIDNSPNNFTITAVGNTRPIAFAPFAVTYSSLQSYTPAVFGGSMYFDGTGDFLTLPISTALGPTTGDYTWEAWIYPATLGSNKVFYVSSQSSGSLVIGVGNSTANRLTVFRNGVAFDFIGTTDMSVYLNTWVHIAVTRLSGTTKFWINGVNTDTFTTNVTYVAGGTAASVGRRIAVSEDYTGSISNMRLINGTARYTSNFVPQNSPLTAVTNTSLLLSATNAGIYDAATLNSFETVGNAQVSTSVKQYGISSMALDGTGDYLIAPSSPFNPVLAFGTGAFTVEFWFYANSSSGTRQLFDTRPAGVTTTVRYMAITYLSGNLNYYTAGANPAIAGGAVATGGWNYVALTRSGTSTRLFINGSQVGSTYTDSQDYLIGVNRPIIGADGADPATANFSGNIQDLRLTRGIARYTSTFTPPVAPLPTS
jgi:hypothetical protein